MRKFTLILFVGALFTLGALKAFAADPGRIMGVPQPSVQPTFGQGTAFEGLKQAGLYSDPVGCLYAFANGTRVIVAGTGCVFPTAAASMTPYPSATPTPSIP